MGYAAKSLDLRVNELVHYAGTTMLSYNAGDFSLYKGRPNLTNIDKIHYAHKIEKGGAVESYTKVDVAGVNESSDMTSAIVEFGTIDVSGYSGPTEVEYWIDLGGSASVDIYCFKLWMVE